MIAQSLFCFENILYSENEVEDKILILELLIKVFTMKISLFLLGLNHILKDNYFELVYFCSIVRIFIFF